MEGRRLLAQRRAATRIVGEAPLDHDNAAPAATSASHWRHQGAAPAATSTSQWRQRRGRRNFRRALAAHGARTIPRPRSNGASTSHVIIQSCSQARRGSSIHCPQPQLSSRKYLLLCVSLCVCRVPCAKQHRASFNALAAWVVGPLLHLCVSSGRTGGRGVGLTAVRPVSPPRASMGLVV